MTALSVDVRPHADRAGLRGRGLPVIAAGGLALAAAVHLSLIPQHLREWWPAGLFFAALAAGQASLAVALVRRPGPTVLLGAIWSSAAVIGLYVWSRTAGLPFIPEHDESAHGVGSQVGHAVGGRGNGVPIFPHYGPSAGIESVGLVDLAALGAELAVVAVVVALLPARSRRGVTNALLVGGLTLLVLRATGVLS